MPREQYYNEGYRAGFRDGYASGTSERDLQKYGMPKLHSSAIPKRPKRKLSAWNKFVKANSNKKKYQYASGKLKLKKMGIAYRKKKR